MKINGSSQDIVALLSQFSRVGLRIFNQVQICDICLNGINVKRPRERIFNQLINQLSIEPISTVKPGSAARKPNQCSTSKSMTQFHGINGLPDVTVSMGKRPNQRDMSSDAS